MVLTVVVCLGWSCASGPPHAVYLIFCGNCGGTSASSLVLGFHKGILFVVSLSGRGFMLGFCSSAILWTYGNLLQIIF